MTIYKRIIDLLFLIDWKVWKNVLFNSLQLIQRMKPNVIRLFMGNSSNLSYEGDEESSVGGVCFLIRKKNKPNIMKIRSFCSRVVYIIPKLNPKYKVKITQVYAQTTIHLDEETKNSMKNKSYAKYKNSM